MEYVRGWLLVFYYIGLFIFWAIWGLRARTFLEQGGMVWVFKLPKSGTQHADAAAATSVKTAKLAAAK